jgi:hypothetical protein
LEELYFTRRPLKNPAFVTFRWMSACRPALLARFLTAALLPTGLLSRRLILLAGLALVRHVVSFQRNTIATAQSPRRSDKTKNGSSHCWHDGTVSLTYSRLHSSFIFASR